MPICTYLDGNQWTEPTSDSVLNSLLEDVRQNTDEDWRIKEIEISVPRWFRKPRKFKLYELVVNIGSTEFQAINFYRPEHEKYPAGFINIHNTAGHVAAFLYGLLEGVREKQKENIL